MIEPALHGDAFLADIEAVRRRESVLDLWWLGQSGFLLQHRERWVLIDPYLSDSLTLKYEQSDKPHVRMSKLVVDPWALASKLQYLNVVTSSHSHTDHLDPLTLKAVLGSAHVGTFIAPKPVIQLAYERSGGGMLKQNPHFKGLDDAECSGGGVKVTAVAAAHDVVERDEQGHCKYLGYVFELSPALVTRSGSYLQGGREWTVYHSGDTVLYDGLVEKLKPFNIDVAILPINGRSPERRVAGNLNGKEAAWLAKEIGAKLVIPCHYDMFEFNTASPDEFVAECERLGQPYRVLKLGERWSSSELR